MVLTEERLQNWANQVGDRDKHEKEVQHSGWMISTPFYAVQYGYDSWNVPGNKAAGTDQLGKDQSNDAAFV